MPEDHPDRSNALQQMMNMIIPMIEAQIAQHWVGEDPPNFIVLMVDDDLMETCSVTTDYDILFDAMSDIGAAWIEQGLITPLDGIDENADADVAPAPRSRTN